MTIKRPKSAEIEEKNSLENAAVRPNCQKQSRRQTYWVWLLDQ